MVGGAGLGLELAEELERLAPFGMGNPACACWCPRRGSATCGRWGKGKHSRFSLRSGSHRALGVAFGRSGLGVEEGDPVDAAVRLEVNRWNGSVEPRVVLRELYPCAGENDPRQLAAEWWRRFEAELARDPATMSQLPPPPEENRAVARRGGWCCRRTTPARRWSPSSPRAAAARFSPRSPTRSAGAPRP